MVTYVQIPNLPQSIALNGTEAFEAVQAGVSVQVSVNQIVTYLQSKGVGLVVGSTPISGGANGNILGIGSSKLSVLGTTGSGSTVVLSNAPTIAAPVITGQLTFGNVFVGVSGSGTSLVTNQASSISGLTVTTSFAATGLVANASLANMAAGTIKANATGGSAAPTDLTFLLAAVAMGQLRFTLLAQNVNIGSSGVDVASFSISGLLGIGQKYIVESFYLYNAVGGSLAGGTIGLFTAAGGGGVAVVTAATAITITTGTAATNNNSQSFTINNANTEAYDSQVVNQGTLTARMGTGVPGRTVSMAVTIRWLL